MREREITNLLSFAVSFGMQVGMAIGGLTVVALVIVEGMSLLRML
jgi:hypothetical protein